MARHGEAYGWPGPTANTGGGPGGGGFAGTRASSETPARKRPAQATIRAQVVRMASPRPSLPRGRPPLSVARSLAAAAVFAVAAGCDGDETRAAPSWPQWGQNARHAGALAVTGQPLQTLQFQYVYDPLVPEEVAASSGSLPVHYMTPLVDGSGVTIETKSGTYSAHAYATQTWGVAHFVPSGGTFAQAWQASSDWKAPGGAADFWEPVFHGALSGGRVYLPGARGSLLELDEATGAVAARVVVDPGW